MKSRRQGGSRARIFIGLLALAGAGGPSCGGDSTCIGSGRSCDEVKPCADLAFSCSAPELFVGVADGPSDIDLENALGTRGDLILRNSQVTAVFDALDAPRNLSTTGGTLIDFGPRGGRDGINQVYQIAGILPDDAFAYDRVEIIDRSPEFVAVVYRGTLEGRSDVRVATRYELWPCDPGVRVYSELQNGSAEIQAFMVTDNAHWGKGDVLPFAPLPEQGFVYPELKLLELSDLLTPQPYVLGRPTVDEGSGYGIVSCDSPTVEAVHDAEISAITPGIRIVRPGEREVFERFWVATEGPGLGKVTDVISKARQMLHGAPRPVTVTGRVVVDGIGWGGQGLRASLLLGDRNGEIFRPLSTVVPGEDGIIEATVPAIGPVSWELWSFGRAVATGTASVDGEVDLGDLEVDLPATVTVSVTDEGLPSFGTVVFQPRDEATRAAVVGSFFGQLTECAPYLGSPIGPSPACNHIVAPPQGVTFEVPAGRYDVYATRGPEYSLSMRAVDLEAGGGAAINFDLSSLEVAPAGWVSADLHVHGRRSFDSSLPDLDRVRTFAAADLDVIAATDHDWVTHYAAAVIAAGVDGLVHVIGGTEVTPWIPYLDVPGSDLPVTVGHFNFFPLVPDELVPRGGSPFDELSEPGELFDQMAPQVGADGILMINHPWDETQFGRDLGYFAAIGYDPRVPIEGNINNEQLLRVPGATHRNIDFNTFELGNGPGLAIFRWSRGLWHSLLSQGHVRAAVGNSDSHDVVHSIGYARTWVDAGTVPGAIDEAAFNRALKDGRSVAGAGVVVTWSVAGRGPGLDPWKPSASADEVTIEVRAPPWIPVDEVRVVTASGVRVLASGNQLSHPTDPFGIDGVVRYQVNLPVGELIAETADDWIVIEAGLAFYDAADLDDDGIVDTTDNNGDGTIDDEDIDGDETSGPYEPPPDPGPEDRNDPRFFVTRVVPTAWPYGFTNPLLVDWSGDGWDAPGLGGAQ